MLPEDPTEPFCLRCGGLGGTHAVRGCGEPEPQSLWGKGCPEFVWDGPYKMRCSLGGDRGTCGTHGKFADPPDRLGTPA